MQIILIWGEANKQKNEKLCTINHNNNKKKVIYYQSVILLFQVRQIGKSWTNRYYVQVGNKYA